MEIHPLDTDDTGTLDPHLIKLIRILLKLTQSEYARLLNVSLRGIQEWESGRRSAPKFLKLALQYVCLQVAMDKNNYAFASGEAGRLADVIAQLRAEARIAGKL